MNWCVESRLQRWSIIRSEPWGDAPGWYENALLALNNTSPRRVLPSGLRCPKAKLEMESPALPNSSTALRPDSRSFCHSERSRGISGPKSASDCTGKTARDVSTSLDMTRATIHSAENFPPLSIKSAFGGFSIYENPSAAIQPGESPGAAGKLDGEHKSATSEKHKRHNESQEDDGTFDDSGKPRF